MSYYKDLLERFNESEFYNHLADIDIANEVWGAFDKGGEYFEPLCDFTRELWLDCESLEPHDIVWSIYDCLEREGLKIEYIENVSDWLEDNYDNIRDLAFDIHN